MKLKLFVCQADHIVVIQHDLLSRHQLAVVDIGKVGGIHVADEILCALAGDSRMTSADRSRPAVPGPLWRGAT